MRNRTPVKLLIVDDVPANLLALEAVLQRPGYELIRANSGQEALRKVEKHVFAAILLDVQMPGLDGYETARRIKAMPNGKGVPIMFLTAVYKEDTDMRRGYDSGGLDYFTKPFDPELLRTKVQIYADLYRMTRQTDKHDKLLAAIQDRLAAERTLDSVLQGISEGVIVSDSAGLVTRANHEAMWIWGGAKPKSLRDKEDFMGWWVDGGKAVKADEWALFVALRTGKVHMNEPIAIQCFDGRSKIIIESASPLSDEKGKVIGAVAVLKVISPEALLDVPRTLGRGEKHGPPLRH